MGECHHHRHRVAGQAHEDAVFDLAEGERPSRFDRDLPELGSAKLGERRLDVIGFAYRYATSADDQVCPGAGVLQGLAHALGIIAYHAQVENVYGQARQHAVQAVAIAVVDHARFEFLADRYQFVTGGKESDHGFAPDLQLRDAERSQHAEVGRAEAHAGFDHGIATAHVFAGLANVLTDAMLGVDADLAVGGRLGLFLHDDGVGAVRDQRAGHDAYALPRSAAAGERSSGKSAADLVELAYLAVDLAIDLAVAQAVDGKRIAVHRRVGSWWHLARRHYHFVIDTIKAVTDRQAFAGRYRAHALFDTGERLGQADHARLEGIDTTGLGFDFITHETRL